ncbi:MAG: hypothetical protein ACFB12_08090 [Leptolyngbyaceae cyanobacterium]
MRYQKSTVKIDGTERTAIFLHSRRSPVLASMAPLKRQRSRFAIALAGNQVTR